MIAPKVANLYFRPEMVDVIGELVTLTDEMAEAGIHRQWWKGRLLLDSSPDQVFWYERRGLQNPSPGTYPVRRRRHADGAFPTGRM